MALTIPTQTAMVRRITKAFRAAKASDLAAGLGWYATAYAAAVKIAQGSADPQDIARVVGVIAALSPRCQWSTNVMWAELVIRCADAGAPMPNVSTMSNRRTAWAIANGTPALDALGTLSAKGNEISGMKVRRFFRNIMGDVDCATVDVWAARVATGKRGEENDKLVGSARGYAAVEQAYRRAAEILGTDTRSVQAATWVAARGVKPTDAGFHADAAELALAA